MFPRDSHSHWRVRSYISCISSRDKAYNGKGVYVFLCLCFSLRVCVFVGLLFVFCFVVLFRFGHCAGASHIDLLKFVSGGGPRNHRPSHYQVRSCSPHHVLAWLGSVVKVPEPVSVCGFPFARGHSSICLSRRGVFF